MGSQPHGNSGPGNGMWASVALIAAVAAVAAVTALPDGWVSSIANATRGMDVDVRAVCIVPGLPLTQLQQDQVGAAPATCRVGGDIQVSVRNSTDGPLYPHVMIFAHGTVASFMWPAADAAKRTPLPPSSAAQMLPFRFQLTQRGASLIVALSDRPLTPQELRAIGRRASSSGRIDGMHTAVYRVEASGIRSPR